MNLGTPDGINIAGVMIGKSDGETIINYIKEGKEVLAELSTENERETPLFRPPEGITIVSM